MNTRLSLILAAALTVTTAVLSTTVAAETIECFPDCPAAPAIAAPSAATPTEPTCGATLVSQVEDVNNRIRPVKQLVGYVRSPQGLALKLVNDHVVKIPAWVGFALDPVGSVKQRVISEARSYVKAAAGVGDSCAAPVETIGDLSIDAA